MISATKIHQFQLHFISIFKYQHTFYSFLCLKLGKKIENKFLLISNLKTTPTLLSSSQTSDNITNITSVFSASIFAKRDEAFTCIGDGPPKKLMLPK